MGPALVMSGGFGKGIIGLIVRRKQLVDSVAGMIGDAGEHLGEPGLRVEAVEFGGLDEGIGDGGGLTSVGRAHEPSVRSSVAAVESSIECCAEHGACERMACPRKGECVELTADDFGHYVLGRVEHVW